jgi:hypothetical protein
VEGGGEGGEGALLILEDRQPGTGTPLIQWLGELVALFPENEYEFIRFDKTKWEVVFSIKKTLS